MIKTGKPLSEQEFIKIHRADFKQRGFDEQVCCMAWYILHLEAYDKITYEKQDDLVITYQDGSKKLIQIKSSVEGNAKITNSSEAFWSTLENWLVYNDWQDEKFSSSVKYCLHTDMEIDNSCAMAINKLKDGEWDIKDVKDELKNLKADKGAVVDYDETLCRTRVAGKYGKKYIWCMVSEQGGKGGSLFLRALGFAACRSAMPLSLSVATERTIGTQEHVTDDHRY